MPELLFLSHRLPYPPDKGDKIRAWHMLRRFAKTHRIHLGCLIDDRADREHLGELSRLCAGIGAFEVRPGLQKLRALAGMRRGKPLTADIFYHPGLQRWVDQRLATRRFDAVFVFSSGMASYVMGRTAS